VTRIRVTRTVKFPDLVRLSRYQHSPELGPQLLFFSGGSALNGVSRALKAYTHNSTHLVTPFDSGGSSAQLRKAFGMPSIGDVRSRMMALANETITGHPEVYDLFTYRFPDQVGRKKLATELDAMISGEHPLVASISNPMRRLIRHQIGYFRDAMPADFDLRGASIGNLILAGGFLNNHQHLDPILFLFSKLVGVLGTVRAVVNEDFHLCADLQDGSRILGQHRMTGKEVAPLKSPIKRLRLSRRLDRFEPAKAVLRKKHKRLIERAELICYPPGSFYSSLIANLLPKGVGLAIAENDSPKVYVPNLGLDPEQIGLSVDQSVTTLLDYLRADVGDRCPDNRLLSFVLIDTKRGVYPSALSHGLMEELGVEVIDTRLVSKRSEPLYDPELLTAALLSMT
jgi:CofD-related protein of GAK system